MVKETGLLVMILTLFACSDTAHKEVKESVHKGVEFTTKKTDATTIENHKKPIFHELFSLELGKPNFFSKLDAHNAPIPSDIMIDDDTLYLLDRG